MTMTVVVLDTEDGPSLLVAEEQTYITETATGLAFAPNTPVEILGNLLTRLTRHHKRLEWCIGDAINFGETNYPGMYEQWVEQTGLAENTLSTMRWVAERIPSLRRREDVGWSHHREVAPLSPEKQDALLERAADKGMTRWQVRQAVRVEQEQLRGRAVNAEGEPMCAAESEPLVWAPDVSDLTDEARALLESNAPGGRHRLGYVSGFLRALVVTDQESMFLPGRFRL